MNWSINLEVLIESAYNCHIMLEIKSNATMFLNFILPYTDKVTVKYIVTLR